MNKTRRKIILIALAALVIVVGAVGAFLVFGRTPEERAAQYLESGKTYFEKGEYVKANLDLRNALQLNERLVDAWYMLSKISQKNGDFRSSFGMLQRAVGINPSHVGAQIDLGKLLLAGKQLDKALEKSDLVMKLEPDSARAHSFRAAVMLTLGNYDSAIAESDKALAVDPKNVEALIVSASTRIRQGKIDDAMAFADRGLAAEPGEAALHILKISTYEKEGRFDDAVAAYKAAIAATNNANSFRRGLVTLYLRNKKTDEAAAVYRDIVASDPDNVGVITEYVRFLRQVRGNETAEKTLLEFVSSHPDKPELKFALASFYVLENKADKAKETYEGLVAGDPTGPTGLSAKSKLAALAAAERDNAKAEKLIAEVLQTEPRNAEALFIRARMRLRAFRTDEAIADLRTVLRDAPDSAAVLLNLARAHVQAGAYDLASERYVQAYAKNPQRNDIRLEYANFLVNRSEYSRAAEVLEAALAINPKFAPALQLMTRVKLELRDFASAQEYANRTEEVSGDPIFSEQVKGAVYRAQDDIDSSIQTYLRAHEIAPDQARPVVALVQTYLQSGRRDEAKRFLAAILQADNHNMLAHGLVGQIAEIEGDWATAEKSYRTIIESNPKSSAGYRSLSAMFMRRGDVKSSEAILNKGLEVVPNNVAMQLALGGVYERQERYDAAIDIYQKIVDAFPGQFIAVNNLASLLSDHRTDQESFQRALRLAERLKTSNFPYFSDTLAWIYYRLKQPEKAVKIQEKVVEQRPNVPIFRYHLGMTYLAIGNREKAKSELQKAVNLGGNNFDQKDAAKAELEKL